MSTAIASDAVRFHLSLNVSSLNASVAFYKALLGVEPAKLRSDYAKFEPDRPPVVLSLEPGGRPPGGNLNHAGLRFPDSKALIEAQSRLEAAGISTKREEGVECCYARQTKFWVFDPDQTLWEIYVLESDLEHRGSGQAAEALPQPTKTASAPRIADVQGTNAAQPTAVWEHRFGQQIPTQIDAETGSQDEVRLQGTFNKPTSSTQAARLVEEAFRILKPGGVVHLRNLVADRVLPEGPLRLPGPAAVVEAVPTEEEVFTLFESAGFVNLRLVHFDAAPCFTQGEVQMRQLRLEAQKPMSQAPAVGVMFRGPFRELRDDSGRIFPRGRRVDVDQSFADLLRSGPAAEQFVYFDGPVAASCQ